MKEQALSFTTTIEEKPVLVSATAFVLGIALALVLPISGWLLVALDAIVGSYDVAAPVIIYALLAPSLIAIARNWQDGAPQLRHVMVWFLQARLAACALAAVLSSLAFGLPLSNAQTAGGTGAGMILGALGSMLLSSPYMWAVYAAVLTALVAARSGYVVFDHLSRVPRLIEAAGRAIAHAYPLFALFLGAYLLSVTDLVQAQLNKDAEALVGSVHLLGISFDPRAEAGPMVLYIALSVLTGALGLIWQGTLMLYGRRAANGALGIARYFGDYYMRIAPLLWITCSEALCTAPNVYLLGRSLGQISTSLRQMIATFGAFLNINGTLMCAFVMIPATCAMLGIDLSAVQMLACLPLIYVLGFAVPGIPGELVLFAGPISQLLGVPDALLAPFIAIFVTIQLGLPDSFRTATNSTDDYFAAVLIQDRLARRGRTS